MSIYDMIHDFFTGTKTVRGYPIDAVILKGQLLLDSGKWEVYKPIEVDFFGFRLIMKPTYE